MAPKSGSRKIPCRTKRRIRRKRKPKSPRTERSREAPPFHNAARIEYFDRLEQARPLPIANRRYSRLQICATRMPSSQPRLTHFTTNRPVAVLMIFLSAVVFGYFSFKRLPVNLMPELNYPTLTVRTEYPGAAPEEVENEISRPIEEALGVIG